MLVTTSEEPSGHRKDLAARLAQELHARFVPRAKNSINQLKSRYKVNAIFVVGNQGIRYYGDGPQPLFFHPSMAMLRVKRLLQGEKDALLEAARVTRGDRILDCTMGLASDAIVFAYAAGLDGKVTALESEQVPYLLAREGLSEYEPGLDALREAMRRIELIHSEHEAYMRNQPDRSVDIVYFDPMFRSPYQSPSMLPLRGIANDHALSRSAVDEARRIARKTIILKECRGSSEFERLGFRPACQSRSKTIYGVIHCD